MANEVTILERNKALGTVDALFLYAIAVPAVVGGTNVVPTPSSTLPALAARILTTQEKADLDAGTKAFEIISQPVNADITPAANVVLMRSRWAIQNAAFASNYAVQYQYIGTRFNAP